MNKPPYHKPPQQHSRSHGGSGGPSSAGQNSHYPQGPYGSMNPERVFERFKEKPKRVVDLNTDYGQSQDKQLHAEITREGVNRLLKAVSSVNIPCCVHDGDPREVLRFIEEAKTHHCAIGAHIAYPDPVHFGYDPMDISAEDLKAWLLVQLGTFNALAHASGIDVDHVRPHGNLYTRLLNDPVVARLVAETVYQVNPWLFLVGPAGPLLQQMQEQVGIRVAPEVYLGKRYTQEGHPLINRFQHEANHKPHPQALLDQARQLMAESTVTAIDGKKIKLNFSTVHLSPRLEHATNVAERLSSVLGEPVSLPVSAVAASGWVAV